MTGVRRVAGSRHLIAGSCVAALAAAFAATEAAAQRPVFSSGIDLVHVGVTIIDDDGNLVTDLTADDFEVLEDGQTQEIRYFSVGLESDADVIPLHLGLLFDMSESMDRSERFQKTAAIRFLNTLTYAADMTVVDFDSEVRVGRYGQDDFGRLIERIRNRRPQGYTALYDALGVYLDGAFEQDGRKVLVLYTDGEDTRSQLSARDAHDLLRASDVTVYAVGFQESLRAEQRLRQRMLLRQLTEITGGYSYFPNDVDDPRRNLRPNRRRTRRPLLARFRLDQCAPGRYMARAGSAVAGSRSPRRYARCADPGARGLLRHLERGRGRGPGRTGSGRRALIARMPSTYDRFTLVTDFELRGDQERAIAELIEGLDRGDPHQVLLGVTGSGKTFTMAHVVAAVNRPTLVMVHNKTLAAQPVPGVQALLSR